MGIIGRSKVDPYRISAQNILDRVLWDIRVESFRSRRKLVGLKDRYRGKKAVIVCNGPSLLSTDLTQLKDVFVIGLNKINLIFDKSPFRPDIIVAVNKLVIEQNRDFFNSTDIPLFIDSTCTRIIRSRSNVSFLKSTNIARFAEDVSLSVYQGHTVTFVAMQLAFHLGFDNVTLVGCDHNFFYQGNPNATMKAEKVDINHFDPTYFSGVNWQLPDIIQSEISYLLALDVYQLHGRVLSNSTIGGKLEVLPRISLEKFLSN